MGDISEGSAYSRTVVSATFSSRFPVFSFILKLFGFKDIVSAGLSPIEWQSDCAPTRGDVPDGRKDYVDSARLEFMTIPWFCKTGSGMFEDLIIWP
jgi:hypothetical protein